MSDEKTQKTVDRLVRLANFLQKLGPAQFNMSFWVSKPGEDHGWGPGKELEEAPKCGTAACVAGWATHICPELVLDAAGVPVNKETGRRSFDAFQDSFPALNTTQVQKLCRHGAPHRTPLAASEACERMVSELLQKG